ncbi:MAG: glutamate racemase [Oscillospiraceae bacterium]
MDKRPIGVFDSGLGGLTAVRELRRILPCENIIYFGDTGRVPYGTRGRDTIIKYAKQDIAFLLSHNVKYIMAACGTVSSTLPLSVQQGLPVPFLGVVCAACKAAVNATKTGRIGVLGTNATISSESYQREIARLLPKAAITATSCPLFVPLVENGYTARECTVTRLVAEDYLAQCKANNVDTLILGCTHYPIIRGIIADIMGEGVTLIDAGACTAIAAKNDLARLSLLCDNDNSGSAEYYVSDTTDSFETLATAFLGEYAGGVCRQIDIEDIFYE